jgi:hypothetical protein
MLHPHHDCTDLDVTEWLSISFKLAEFVTASMNGA